jgi:hypothetical protein
VDGGLCGDHATEGWREKLLRWRPPPITRVAAMHSANLRGVFWMGLAPGDDPGFNGTYGRFRCSPARNVFVLVSEMVQNEFLNKPPTTAP